MSLGEAAPEFSLPDLNGRLHDLRQYRGRIVILNFWSCACPHSERTDSLLMEWLTSWRGRVALLSIASNANESPEAIAAAAARRKIPLVLLDAGQRVADLYKAQTTPHVFVVDPLGLLQYSGAVDDVTFGRRQPGRYFLKEAVQAILDAAVQAIDITQPYGCAIVRHALE